MCKSLEIEEDDAFLHRAVRKKCSEWWTPEENEIRTKCAEECKELTQGGNCLADENCESEGQICEHHTGKCYTPDAIVFEDECTANDRVCEITSSNHEYCCSQWGYCGNSDGHCTGEETTNYRESTLNGDTNGKQHLAEARARAIVIARQDAVQEAKENNTRWDITEDGKCGILIPEMDGDQFETCDPDGKTPCCSPYGWCQKTSKDGGYWCEDDTPVSVKSVASIRKTNKKYSGMEKFGCHLKKFDTKAKCTNESGCTWKSESGKCTTSQICANNTEEGKCLNAANKLEICSWKTDDEKKEGYCHPNGYVNEIQAGRDCKDKWSDSQANCDDKWRCQWNENGTKGEQCEVAPKPTCDDIRNHKDKGHICKDATNNKTCVTILKGKDLCEGN